MVRRRLTTRPARPSFFGQSSFATWALASAMNMIKVRRDARAHRIVAKVDAGFCWMAGTSHHVQGSTFGGQEVRHRPQAIRGGIAVFTQDKNIFIDLNN